MSIDTSAASSASSNSTASAAGVAVLKKAIDLQANSALKLLQSAVSPAPVASSGSVGTQLNQYA